jgi:hypothetical protein
MKNFALKLVWFTTAYVFIFVSLCQTNIASSLILSLMLFEILLILFTIYLVLTDKYTTTNTFKDWYGDHPRDT